MLVYFIEFYFVCFLCYLYQRIAVVLEMNYIEHRLLKILKCEFQRDIDDTLINRLVNSIMCRHVYHDAVWVNSSIVFLDQLLEHISLPRRSLYELKMIIKILFVLQWRYYLHFHDFNVNIWVELKRLALMGSNFMSTFVDSFAIILRNINTLNDLLILSWVFDEELIDNIFKHLSVNESIYKFNHNIYILGHYLYLKAKEQNFNESVLYIRECSNLTDLGIEILLAYSIVSNKILNCKEVVTIPFDDKITVDNFASFSNKFQEILIFLLCSNTISSSSTTQKWILFLSDFKRLQDICIITLKTFLKYNITSSSNLYEFIKCKWLEFLMEAIRGSKIKLVEKLMFPFKQFNKNLHLIEISENMVTVVVDELFNNRIYDLNVRNYHSNLFVFLNVAINNFRNLHIVNFSKILCYLSNVCTYKSTFEAKSVFNCALDFVIMYFIQMDQHNYDISEYVQTFLNEFLNLYAQQDVFIPFVLAFLRLLKYLTCSNEGLVRSIWSNLFKILLHISVWEDEVQENSGIITELMCDLLFNVANHSWISFWNNDIRKLFIQFLNNSFDIAYNVNFSGLMLSSFITLLLSAHYESDYPDITEILFNKLLDFDLLELTTHKSVCDLLWTNIQNLAKVSYPLILLTMMTI